MICGTRSSRKYLKITLGLIAGVFFTGISLVGPSDFDTNNVLRAYPQGLYTGNSTFGIISSLQNNEEGDPFWIVSGHWKTSLLNFVNQSELASSENISQKMSTPTFNTSVRMITLNGTGEHTHAITNFELRDILLPNNTTTVFEGISTASLREGPVTDIPTTITITNGKVISIWLDPVVTNNHYGDTPIYGLVMNPTDFNQQHNQSDNSEASIRTQQP